MKIEEGRTNNITRLYDSIQLKIVLVLKLPHFYPHRKGGEKAQQFQIGTFLTELSRSDIFLALGTVK